MKTFAEAMVDVVHATDGNGVPVHLYRGNWTADSLRETTRAFADTVTPSNVAFTPGQEVAAWENLAKLSVATAAAIREGR